MFVFLVSLQMMGGAFKLFGKDFAHVLINSTSNPFVGLFIGLLATAIIQSSSTTTSMIVVMVAAGDLTLLNAVPMLMGANIGTSVTSTIVSMGHIGKRKEFRKAISAATIHDFFNIMVAMILLPLEVAFGFVSNLATSIAGITFTNEAVGTYLIKFVQTVGSKTVNFPDTWLWSGGAEPVVSATLGRTDIVTLIYDGTNYYAAIVQNFF